MQLVFVCSKKLLNVEGIAVLSPRSDIIPTAWNLYRTWLLLGNNKVYYIMRNSAYVTLRASTNIPRRSMSRTSVPDIPAHNTAGALLN